jgi:hypothetical protein
MANASDFFDAAIKGLDAYGNFRLRQAEIKNNYYGGHGMGGYVDANGYPDDMTANAQDKSMAVPAWMLLAGAAVLVFVLARR